jgi:hypothetical protein
MRNAARAHLGGSRRADPAEPNSAGGGVATHR